MNKLFSFLLMRHSHNPPLCQTLPSAEPSPIEKQWVSIEVYVVSSWNKNANTQGGM